MSLVARKSTDVAGQKGRIDRHADCLNGEQRDTTTSTIRASVLVPEVRALRVHVQRGLEAPHISRISAEDGSGSSHDGCVPTTSLNSLDGLVSVATGPQDSSSLSVTESKGSTGARHGSPASRQAGSDTSSRADPRDGNSIKPLESVAESTAPFVWLKGQWKTFDAVDVDRPGEEGEDRD
jgi:hypothetical protein